MERSIIVLGDTTDHGGKVITASPFTDDNGKGLARLGDMVSCPRCKGSFPISEGDRNFIVDGQPLAYDGHKVACGARLISRQIHLTSKLAGGAAPRAGGAGADDLAANLGSIGAGLVASYQEEPLGDAGQRFKGRFRLLDQASGEPIVAQQARLHSTGGQSIGGSTDAEGYTQGVERDASEALSFNLVELPKA